MSDANPTVSTFHRWRLWLATMVDIEIVAGFAIVGISKEQANKRPTMQSDVDTENNQLIP